jgi:nucleoside-diphosphate-sugar epimerase
MNQRSLQTEHDLELALSEPTERVIETIRQLEGDFLLLGAAGKMGLSLAHMIRRALNSIGDQRRVVGVSRFNSVNGQVAFQERGIETICCDLLDEAAVEQLPQMNNVIAMTGMKFGSSANASQTWAMNAYLPAIVCRRFRSSRIVAFSTGNVYAYTSTKSLGSRESDPLEPVGEYGMSCVGRERMYDYFSRRYGIPLSLIRLNYACDLRYGVLVDLANKVLHGQPVDLSMGYFNTIWQGDANAWTLESFAHTASPPWVVNVTGCRLLSVREVAERMARILGRSVQFQGLEAETALASDTRLAQSCFSPVRLDEDQLITSVATWVGQGGRTLNKPTHFESRTGKF